MKVVHQLIAKTAKEIANEAYEMMAHDNAFHAEWPVRSVFVTRNWPMFVEGARTALLQILQSDAPEQMKEPIYEAFLIDGGQKKPHAGFAGVH